MAEETTPDNLPGGNAFSQEGTTNLNDFLPFGGKEPDFEDRSHPSMLRNMYPQMNSIDVPNYNIKDNVAGLSPYTNQKSFKGLSVKDQVRALGNLTISKLNTLQDPNTYGKINAYDSSPSGAHRARYAAYGRETFDRIGFHPEVNNEAIYNDQTTAWDDFVRMAKHSAWPLFSKGFVANPKSYAGIFSGDFKQDPDEAYDYEEANAIGMSTKGGVGAFLTNAVNSFAYSAGIITEAIVEDAVIGGILGATGGPGTAAAGTFLGGAVGAVKGLATVPKALYQMTRSGATLLKNLKNLDKVNDARIAFNAASKTVGEFINPFNNTTDAIAYNRLQNSNNLRNMARSANSFGAFYKDVRNINMALSEGRLEGGFVQNNTYKELYDKYYAQHGVAPSDEKQREFMDVARKAGADDTWYNTMLIFYTNKLVIPNVMRGGVLRSIPGYTDDILDLGTHRILWNPKANFELVRSNFKNSIKALAKPAYYGKSAASYFKANVSEGLQENMQDVLSEYTQRSYIDAYNDPSKSTWDYSKGLLKNAVNKQFSAQGFETFASGFVIGGFAKPFNALPKYLSIGYDKYIKYGDKYEEYVEGRRKSGQDAVDTLNELYKDPKEFFNHRYFNYGMQSLAAKEDDDESTTSKEANDARDRAFISQMVTVLETGTMKYFIDHIDGFKDMQPEEIEKAFGLKAGEGINAIQRIDTIKERAKRIEKRYEYSKNKLPNPVDLSLFDKDTDEYKKAATLHQAWNVARANQIFMGESFDRNLERITGIAGNIMSIADFSNISSADLNAITDVDRLSNEIDMLSDQVKSAESAGVTDKNTIKAKQKLDDLKNIEAALKGLYVDIFARESLNEITKEYIAKGYDSQTAEMKAHEQTKEEYEKLSKELLGGFKEAVVTYLKNLSGNETTYQEIMSKLENQGKVSGIDEMMTSLIDIHKLRHENTSMVKYINLLNDPAEYMEHVNRNYQWMYDLYKNRKNYFKDTVNRSFEEKEYNDLLQSLAEQGIYVDLDEFADWIEDKTKLPSEFEDAPNKRVIKRGTPLYNEIAARFIRLAQIQEQKAAGEKVNVNEQLKEELDELEVKKQKELDAAREKYEEALKEETGFTEEELKIAPETEAPETESALATNLKSIADEIESISIQTDEDVEKLIELADKANQFINEDEFIKRYDNLTKKEKEQVKEINKGFNKKAGDPKDNTYARIVKYLTPLMIQEELDRMTESEVEESEAKINIEETQAYKDYQEAIAEINAKYEQLAQDLFEEYKKKGATAKTAEEAKEAVIKPTTETQWEDLPEELRAKLQPLFDKYLKTNFPKEKDDSRLSLIRSNWLKTQGNEIDAYNNAQFGTEDVEEVLLKEPPKFKSLKASSETLKTKNIKELLLIRDALQKKLDTRKKLVNNKPVALTKKEITDITSDIRDLNGYIAYRRTLQPLKSEALQTSEDLKRNILDVQDQVEEIKDADGHVIGRRIIGVNTTDVSARVTEEVDLIKRQLNPDYDGVLYNGLKNKEDGSPGTIDVLIEQVQNDKNFDTKEKQVDAFVKALEAAYKERKIKKFGSDRKLKLVKDFFLNKDNPKEFTRDNIRYIIGNLASQESAIAGQTVDQIGRDFFQDVKIKKPANMSEIAYKNLLAILNKLGDKIRGSKDQEIVSERIILFNREYVSPSGKKGLTGEIDLLKLTIDGEYYILDMKTGSRFTWDNFEIDEKEAEVIDLLKPTAFKTKGPSISEESIDWDKSDYSLEDVIDDIGSIKSIKVLETEGADKKGVVRGTVRIQGNNGKTDIEVVFTSGTIKQEVNDNKFSKKLDYSAQLTFYRNLFTIMMNGKKPAGMFLLPFEIELEGEDGYIKDLKLASIADPDTMLYELNEVEEVNKLLPISNLPKKSETSTTDAKADKINSRINSLKTVIASYQDDVIPGYEEERKGLISQKNLATNPDLVSNLETKIKEYDDAIKGAKESLETAKKELAALEGKQAVSTDAKADIERKPGITVLPNGNLKIVAFRTEKVGPTSKQQYQRGKGLYLSLDKPYPGEDVYTVEIELSPENLLDRKLGFGKISEEFFIDQKNKRADQKLDTLHEFKQSLGIKAEIGSVDEASMNELVLFDENLINQALLSKKPYNAELAALEGKPDKPVINIYWGSPESSTNTRVLSNLAPRKFTYQGKEYGSVEHAYQTLKSGTFDQVTYDKYVKAGGYGTKIRGKAVTQGFDNLQLMRDLVVESFKQNPDQAALLLNYSDFTHTTNEVIDKAFLEGIKLAQKNAELAALENQAQYTEYKPKSQKLASNVNKTVIYNGKVGTLINFPHESGSYGIETEDSIFEINGYDDSKMNDLGISTIRLNPELFSNPVIDDVEYNIEFTSEDKSTANINGVNYTIERNAKGGVKSLTYEAHEAEIAKLSEEIDAIQKKYNTAAENMQKAIDAGEDDIMIAPMNLQLVRISNKLEFLKARLSNLSANNKLVTTRNRALIQALQSLPDSFKKSTTKDEEDEDLDNLSSLGESGTAITDMNDILDEDYPAKFDMLITDLSGLNSDDLSTFTKYANNVISKLEELQLRYEAEDKITTDIENEIVVFKTLLNYIENIKLNKNGKVSKQQPKEVRGLQKELQENENEFAIQGPESGEAGEVSEQETEPGGRRSVTKQELRQIIKTVFGTKTSEQLGSEEFLEEFEESEKGLVEIEQLFEDSDAETLESQYGDLLDALFNGEEIGVSAAVLDKLYDKRRRELSKIIKTKNIKEGDYLINTKGKFTEVVKVSDISDDLYTLLNEQTDETVEMTFDQLKKNYKKYYRQMIEEETEELDEQVSDETAESASQTSTVVEETLKDTEALNKHVDELKNLSRADRRKKMNNTSKLC